MRNTSPITMNNSMPSTIQKPGIPSLKAAVVSRIVDISGYFSSWDLARGEKSSWGGVGDK